MQDNVIKQTDEIEIDLGKIFRALARHWLAIVLSALLGAGVFSWVTGCLIPPRYESGVMFYVCSVSGEVLSPEDLSIARKLVESCMVLLNTRETQQGILDHTGMDMSCKELEERITAEAMGETEFFRVTVSGENPVEAERIADAIGAILPGRISVLIDGFSVRVADAAVLPSEATEPDGLRSALTGFLLGAVLSVTVIAVKAQLMAPGSVISHRNKKRGT